MAKTTDQHRKLARAYLDPASATRGNWRSSARAAGFRVTPQTDSLASLKALEEVESELRLEDRVDVQPPSPPEPPKDPDVELMRSLLDGDPDWVELLPVAKRVLAKVATGAIEASTGQVTSLKEIISRGEKQQQEREQGDVTALEEVSVIVLPVVETPDGRVVDLAAFGDEESPRGPTSA